MTTTGANHFMEEFKFKIPTGDHFVRFKFYYIIIKIHFVFHNVNLSSKKNNVKKKNKIFLKKEQNKKFLRRYLWFFPKWRMALLKNI